MRVLGLAGSLRQGSFNLTLLRAAADLLPPDVEFEIWEGLEAIPPYNEDVDAGPAPDPVVALREVIAEADALLVSTPEYNASIPGLLKNALDWASRPFPENALRGKPTLVVGASESLFGAVWAQAELRKVLNAIGAAVIDEELPVTRAHEAFDSQGRLGDPELRAKLDELATTLIDHARSPERQPAAALA